MPPLDPDSRVLATLDLRPPMLGFCFQGFPKAHVPVRAGAPPPQGRGPRAPGQQPLELFLKQLLGPLRAPVFPPFGTWKTCKEKAHQSGTQRQ